MQKIAWIGVAAALIVGATIKLVSDLVGVANQESRIGTPPVAGGCRIVLVSVENASSLLEQRFIMECDRVDQASASANVTYETFEQGLLFVGLQIPVWPLWWHEWIKGMSKDECEHTLHGRGFLIVITVNQTHALSNVVDHQKIEILMAVNDWQREAPKMRYLPDRFWMPLDLASYNPIGSWDMTWALADVLCDRRPSVPGEEEIYKVHACCCMHAHNVVWIDCADAV